MHSKIAGKNTYFSYKCPLKPGFSVPSGGGGLRTLRKSPQLIVFLLTPSSSILSCLQNYVSITNLLFKRGGLLAQRIAVCVSSRTTCEELRNVRQHQDDLRKEEKKIYFPSQCATASGRPAKQITVCINIRTTWKTNISALNTLLSLYILFNMYICIMYIMFKWTKGLMDVQ